MVDLVVKNVEILHMQLIIVEEMEVLVVEVVIKVGDIMVDQMVVMDHVVHTILKVMVKAQPRENSGKLMEYYMLAEAEPVLEEQLILLVKEEMVGVAVVYLVVLIVLDLVLMALPIPVVAVEEIMLRTLMQD